MRCLIFGATGLVGNSLISSQILKGSFGTSTKSTGQNLLKFHLFDDDPIEFLSSGDIRKKNFSHSIFSIMPINVSDYEKLSKAQFELHLEKTKQLISACVEYGMQPVFFSSDYVFQGNTGNYKETDITAPTTKYGLHKKKIEDWISELHPQSLILRLGKVISTKPEEVSIFYNWYNNFVSNQIVVIAKDQFIGPIHTGDVVRSTIHLMKHSRSGVYNLSNGEAISRRELFYLLKNAMQSEGQTGNPRVKEVSLSELMPNENRPQNSCMANEKSKKDTEISFLQSKAMCQMFVKNMMSS